MSESVQAVVSAACERCGKDPTRLMDVAWEVQRKLRHVPAEAIDAIAKELGLARVDVQSLVSFYAFLSEEPKGEIVIRLSDDIVDVMHGYERVKQAFEEELGISVGETTPDGKFTLERTACVGLSDQAPAALINEVPVIHLDGEKARDIVRDLREHGDPHKLVREYGDGENAHELVKSMVHNNLRKVGPIIFSDLHRAEAIKKSVGMSPQEVIRAIKTSRLRGRGGAGFPAGLKWEFTRGAPGEKRYVVCNADEGEPGTFKDRAILTEIPDRLFAGMTIAGYAIGAAEGILYLRAEYEYLLPYLEAKLESRRQDGLLGKNVSGREGFDFDIRIQMGAGAYVCGEETALLSSCEGKRGDPRNRPPFPAQKGYLGMPTIVNNVETLCCVTKIMEEGPATFSAYGNDQSSGTKLLSVSGDCKKPGIYELPFGITVSALLELVGSEDAQAVQIGGPSGQIVGPDEFERKLGFDDLPTGGSIIVFGPKRDLLKVAHAFMEFFVDESCGYCTPCRVGNVLLMQTLEDVIEGRADASDLEMLEKTGEMIKKTSRCGLGQTSPNPILSTLQKFRKLYEDRLVDSSDGRRPNFDLKAAVGEAERITGRQSVHA
jgi:[NiFe] hydrogenase diaphorase moiety large subunit